MSASQLARDVSFGQTNGDFNCYQIQMVGDVNVDQMSKDIPSFRYVEELNASQVGGYINLFHACYWS
jgi:hypothetical protein